MEKNIRRTAKGTREEAKHVEDLRCVKLDDVKEK
jgi:hypothetical protein